jgi:hypothetical protein
VGNFLTSRVKLLKDSLPYFVCLFVCVIFLSTPKSPKLKLPLRSFHWTFVYISHLSHVCYISRPSHAPGFYHPNIWRNVHITRRGSKMCNFVRFPVTFCYVLSLPFKYSSQHPVLITPSIYVFPWGGVGDHVSQLYRTGIGFYYILLTYNFKKYV